jgi:homoserine dehydrogenase
LLAANAFGMPLRFTDAQIEGITQLQALDVACAEQLGFRIKLLGVARRQAQGVELRVQPALVPATHLMANVHGAMNAVMVKADAAGVTLYYGAGAGSEQTASAVIADLVDVARLDGADTARQVPHLGVHAYATNDLSVLPRAMVSTPHYLRVPVRSASGIQRVAACLAEHKVPVRQVALAAQTDGAGPHVLVLTASVPQGVLDLAVHALQSYAEVSGAVTSLRVEELAA